MITIMPFFSHSVYPTNTDALTLTSRLPAVPAILSCFSISIVVFPSFGPCVFCTVFLSAPYRFDLLQLFITHNYLFLATMFVSKRTASSTTAMK